MRRLLIALLIAAVALALALLSLCAKALAQSSEGHARYHEYYKHWRQPANPAVSCCNAREYADGRHYSGDCAPTTARLKKGKDGLIHWFAKLPLEELQKGWGDENGEVEIADANVLHERNPSIEEAHLCFSYGRVLCFVPPDTGG